MLHSQLTGGTEILAHDLCIQSPKCYPFGHHVTSGHQSIRPDLYGFHKKDSSKDDKVNVLVIMDAFPKLTVAMVTPNEMAKVVAKALLH